MYYLFILKKSLIFKKHKPLIIHDLREVWYPIQKGGIHMPKMQQCINLTSIEKINSFEQTCYSVELNKKIIQIIKKSSGKIYNPTPIPLSTFEPNATSIINAINQQYFEIKLDDIYLVTCNPFHARLQSHKHKHKGLVTTSDIFMRHLAHQWPENPTEGLWNIMHYFAKENKSTDVHICTNRGVTYKRNGQLQWDWPIIKDDLSSLMYLIKLKSQLDPAISQKPQDGAYCFYNDQIKIDVRTSTLPTQEGEMISLRLFHDDQSLESLDNIGFSREKIINIRSLLNATNGLILITGTTGSGKSTTLYAMLRELTHRHVITLEDPIERIIPGIHQTSINQWQNYTMDNGLKAMLRHNPDVIAIGEIRDNQTAETVINAAYSGHLVIASLHTNDIEATLLRLSNLGVSPFLISYCLRGIISQSLTYDKQTITLNSQLLICKTPYIINNIKKELTAFLKHNTLIK